MAITNSDGSIILFTKVDTSGVNKGLSTIKNSLKTVATAMGLAFSVTQLVQFSKASANLATQTEASVQRLIDIYGQASKNVGVFIDTNAQALGMSEASAASFASVYGNLFSVWADQATNAQLTTEYLNMTAVVASKTGRTMADVQERIRSGLLGNTEAVEDLGIFVNIKTIEMTEAFKRVADGRSWDQLTAYEQSQVRTLAILEQATNKYGNQVAETSALTRARFSAAFEDFKNTWGQVVNLVLIPVLKVLTQVFTVATAGINALMGRSGNILEGTEAISSNISQSAENQNALTESVKDTNKELKKSLAGFDDLQILSSGASDAAGAGAGASGLQGISGNFGETIDGEAYVSEVSATLTAIMGIVGLALAAVGLILLFTGNVGWGIGFIIAGATVFSVTMATASSFDMDGIIQMMTTIMGIAGGALLALGIILLWVGGVVGKAVAIGMIISGGALIVGAVATQAALSPDDVGAWLSIIMGIAGGALLALGIILCMVGSVPIGVGMIIAGGALIVSAVAMNFNWLTDKIKGWVAVIMAIAGAAMLVLGIILCVTGVGLVVGITLIAAGASALVTPIALNWNAIKEKISTAFDTAMKWIKTYGGLVLGIILVMSGVAAPFGWALIMDSIGSLGKGEKSPLWSNIIDNIKNTWNSIKAYWNANIANVWTLEFWLGLAKIAGNGLIDGFELAINGIIGMFENMINWIVDGINSISFDIPDWVPGIGGDTFGFNIPEASFGRVKIPRLAQGAVIPANREFLAVLGDQRQGVNIETPLETMIEAFQMALDSRGGIGTTEVVLEIDGREFGRAVVEQGNKESRRVGTRLVIV